MRFGEEMLSTTVNVKLPKFANRRQGFQFVTTCFSMLLYLLSFLRRERGSARVVDDTH